MLLTALSFNIILALVDHFSVSVCLNVKIVFKPVVAIFVQVLEK